MEDRRELRRKRRRKNQIMAYAAAFMILAVVAILIVYIVIKKVDLMEKILGKGGIYILRKFFGIILLAMSVKLIVTNLSSLLN